MGLLTGAYRACQTPTGMEALALPHLTRLFLTMSLLHSGYSSMLPAIRCLCYWRCDVEIRVGLQHHSTSDSHMRASDVPQVNLS